MVLAQLETLNDQQNQAIQTVTMYMWQAYVNAFLERIPEADGKTCFNHSHIASYFGKAIDAVRMDEHKALTAAGSNLLTHTNHHWLRYSSESTIPAQSGSSR